MKLKFRLWLYKKTLTHIWKLQLEITSDKKVIAKKPLTTLYEMNSRKTLIAPPKAEVSQMMSHIIHVRVIPFSDGQWDQLLCWAPRKESSGEDSIWWPCRCRTVSYFCINLFTAIVHYSRQRKKCSPSSDAALKRRRLSRDFAIFWVFSQLSWVYIYFCLILVFAL